MSAAEGPGESAEIIAFPALIREPDCRICEHSIADANGTYCTMFREEIFSEASAAKECEEYEEDEYK